LTQSDPFIFGSPLFHKNLRTSLTISTKHLPFEARLQYLISTYFVTVWLLQKGYLRRLGLLLHGITASILPPQSIAINMSSQVPLKLLGISPSRWTRSNLRIMLDRYGQTYQQEASRNELIHTLGILAVERGLDRDDRLALFGAKGALINGTALPPLKPLVHQSYNAEGAQPEAVVTGAKRSAPHQPTTESRAEKRRHLATQTAATYNTVSNEPSTSAQKPARAFDSAIKPSTETQATVPAALSVQYCAVCFESITTDDKPHRTVTSTCQHEIDTCHQCLATSISTQLSDKMWDQIGCPSCGERLTSDDVQVWAAKQTRERYFTYPVQCQRQLLTATFRYNDLALEAYLTSSPQFQRCRHPGCESGGFYDSCPDDRIVCESCAGLTCIQCDIVWDTSHSCVDVATRRAEDVVHTRQEAQTSEYLSKETRDCNNCGSHHEKIGGCDHMKCRSYALSAIRSSNLLLGPKCEYEYCWVCLADWKAIKQYGNAHHLPDCRYNTANLRGNEI